MSQALVGLGANLGDPRRQLELALAGLRALADVKVDRVSRFLATRPIGGPDDQPEYLNAAALLHVRGTPQALWESLASIEHQLGRARSTRWGARTIDLDLLLFDDLILDSPQLTIPHPRLAVRRFALEPAAEIASTMLHPRIGWTIGELYDHLVSAPPILFVFGSSRERREELCARLREHAAGWAIEAQDAKQLVATALVVQPKLIVLLDEPTSAGARLRKQVEELRRGPYLIVDVRDGSRLWDEVTAALAAMT